MSRVVIPPDCTVWYEGFVVAAQPALGCHLRAPMIQR